MELHNILLHAHKGFAYLAIILVVVFIIALLKDMFGYSGNISKLSRKSTLFTMIFFHLQFLVGAVMLFATSGFMNMVKSAGMGEIMKNAPLRFQYIEHPISMLVCAVLMTVINKKLKSNEKLNFGILIMALIVAILFFYAVPFGKLIGNA